MCVYTCLWLVCLVEDTDVARQDSLQVTPNQFDEGALHFDATLVCVRRGLNGKKEREEMTAENMLDFQK